MRRWMLPIIALLAVSVFVVRVQSQAENNPNERNQMLKAVVHVNFSDPERQGHLDSLARGETLTVNMKWSNVGVGKLYRRFSLMLYLLDAGGEIASRQVQADVAPTRWLPGDQSAAASLPVPANLQAGQYTLGLALLDPATEKPAIRLAIDAPQADRLYRVSAVRVK